MVEMQPDVARRPRITESSQEKIAMLPQGNRCVRRRNVARRHVNLLYSRLGHHDLHEVFRRHPHSVGLLVFQPRPEDPNGLGMKCLVILKQLLVELEHFLGGELGNGPTDGGHDGRPGFRAEMQRHRPDAVDELPPTDHDRCPGTSIPVLVSAGRDDVGT